MYIIIRYKVFESFPPISHIFIFLFLFQEHEDVYDAGYDDYEEKNEEEEEDTYLDDQYDDEGQEDDKGEEDNGIYFCFINFPIIVWK